MWNIRRRPMQSFLTILQVALAVACMVSVASYKTNVAAAIDRFESSTKDIVIVMGGTETRRQSGYMRTTYNIFDDNDISELAADTSLVEAVTPFIDSWGGESRSRWNALSALQRRRCRSGPSTGGRSEND